MDYFFLFRGMFFLYFFAVLSLVFRAFLLFKWSRFILLIRAISQISILLSPR